MPSMSSGDRMVPAQMVPPFAPQLARAAGGGPPVRHHRKTTCFLHKIPAIRIAAVWPRLYRNQRAAMVSARYAGNYSMIFFITNHNKLNRFIFAEKAPSASCQVEREKFP